MKKIILLFSLLFSSLYLQAARESQSTSGDSDQATFKECDRTLLGDIDTGSCRGCQFQTSGYQTGGTTYTHYKLWFSSRAAMHGAITIRNKCNVPIRIQNDNDNGSYRTLQPNEEETFKFNSDNHYLTARKQDSTTNAWSIAPTANSVLSDWIQVTFCKVNYASFGAADAPGSNALGTV